MKSTAAMESASTTTMTTAMLRKDWRRQAECSKRNHKRKDSRNTGFLHFAYLHFLRNFWMEIPERHNFYEGGTSISLDAAASEGSHSPLPKRHFTPTLLAT
jgi:hypothetical protein